MENGRENAPIADGVVLKMVDIQKVFPGVKALDNARLTVRRGTVHALMGENGAGKSTFSAFMQRTAAKFLLTAKRLISKAQKRHLKTASQWCIRSLIRRSNAVLPTICGSADF